MLQDSKYSIKQVAALTGLSSHLIRAWEKRYNAVIPQRSEGERRLFSDADVERLILLRDAVNAGYRISDIAGKTKAELIALTTSAKFTEKNSSYGFLEQALAAVGRYDPGDLENILFDASIKLSQDELIYELIVPLIVEIGERWQQGIFNIAQEHISTPVLISFLHYLKGKYKIKQNAPLLLTCAPKGQFHELGALLIAVISSSQGWKVIHLGTNIPAAEIASTAEFTNTKMIALSIIYPPDDPELKKELMYLRENVKADTLIMAGGRAAESYKYELHEAGVKFITDLKEFSETDLVTE